MTYTGDCCPTEGPGIDIFDTTRVGLGGDTILLYHANGSPVSEYAATDAGLDLASAASMAGDRIEIPQDVILSSDHTLIADVNYLFFPGSLVTGELTLASGTKIYWLRQVRTANDANDLVGIIGPASDIAYLYNCEISVTQNGAGTGTGITNSGTGKIYQYGGKVYGSTINVAPNSYGYIKGGSIGSGSLPGDSDIGTEVGGLTIGNWYCVESSGGPFYLREVADQFKSWCIGAHDTSVFDPDTELGYNNFDGPKWHDSYSADLISYAERIPPYYYRFYFQATGTSIWLWTFDPNHSDNAPGFTLDYEIFNATVPAAWYYVLDVEGGELGVPLDADRAAWNALEYPALHTNDIDLASGIHWTLDELDSRYLTGAGSPYIIYASSVAELDTDLLTGGGTDDTANLQGVLDLASTGHALMLIMDGPALVSGLNVYSNTIIYCLEGAGFYLADNSKRAIIRNVNRSRGAITDEYISVIGGFYNGNRQNNAGIGAISGQEVDNTYIVGLQFFGVNHLNIQNVSVYNARVYHVHIANANFITLDNIFIDCGSDHPAGGGQDGVHINGPIEQLHANNLKITSWDDAIAINAGDSDTVDVTIANDLGPYVGQGLISQVIVDGLYLRDCLMGVRLLSHDSNSRIDKVIIKNVVGSVRVTPLLMSYWLVGSGDYGDIVIDGWNVQNTEEAVVAWDAWAYIEGNFESLTLRNIKIHQQTVADPILWISHDSNINFLDIEGLSIYDDNAGAAGMIPIQLDGYVKRFRLAQSDWYRVSVDQATLGFISMTNASSKIDELIINGLSANLVDHLVDHTSGTLSFILASNIKHEDGVASFSTTGTVGYINLSNYYKDAGDILSGTFTTQEGDAFISSLDEKVKVSATDTTEDYLQSKLVAGNNITLTKLNGGGNETMRIAMNSQYRQFVWFIDGGEFYFIKTVDGDPVLVLQDLE